MNFFRLIFPRANIFFVLNPASHRPNKFSNGPQVRDPCNSLVASLLAQTPSGRTAKRWRLRKNGRNPALQQYRQVTLLANFTLII